MSPAGPRMEQHPVSPDGGVASFRHLGGVNHKSRLRKRPRRNHGESDTTWALCVVLIGAIGLLQAHGIAFWSGKLGPYGIAWSVLLEATALWLWSRPAIGSRALACLASVLLLLGPLYQVGTPILDGLVLAEHSDRARSKEIPMAENQIRELEGQLAVFTANSEKRPGWLPAIEATQARLTEARGKLAALYREAPRSTARIEVQETLVIAMECIGLLLFQIAAVLAITTLARERRFRLAAEAWHPFGVGRGSVSASVTPLAKTDPASGREREQRGDVAPGTGTRPRRGPQAKAWEVQAAWWASGTWTCASVLIRRAEAAQWLSAPSSFRPLGSCPSWAVFPVASTGPSGKALGLRVVPWRLRYKAAPLLFERPAPLPPRACAVRWPAERPMQAVHQRQPIRGIACPEGGSCAPVFHPEVNMNTTTFGTETRAYFPVSLKPVFVGDAASQVQDYRAVVREDTGAVLGIHRGAYKLVPNREVFEPFDEAIMGPASRSTGSRSRKVSPMKDAPWCGSIPSQASRSSRGSAMSWSSG